MQIRVVTGQPWEVAADLLVVPVVGEPDFDGELGELDRRTGGELQRPRRVRRAAPQALRHRACGPRRAAGQAGPRRLRRRRRRSLDREIARRAGRHGPPAPRRPRGPVRWPSGWGPWPQRLGGDEALAAELVARGVVEGEFEPKTIYREDSDAAPPALDELVLVAVGDAGAVGRGAERGRIIGEGANMARRLSNRSANDVTPQVLADEARAIAEAHGLWIDVIDEKRAAELGMGMFLAVGRGSDNPPRMIVHALGRGGREGRARPAPRAGRQGRLLRLRRHQHQAGRPDGRDEDGQDRCLHRDRGHRHRRPPGARACRCSRSRRPSRTCPAGTRPAPATSSRRSTASGWTSSTPTPRAG